VPKRQPKPEPITPEEVMGSPALQGFDTFLRYRTAEGPELENGWTVEPASVVSTGAAGPNDSPAGVTPIGHSPSGDAQVGDIHALSTIAEFRPGPKIRRALKIQDGHSTGEHAVYQALWNAASVETPDTRLIRIGYGGLQSLCGLDKTNCKDNIQSLIRKLAVEVVSPFSVQRNQGNVYRIFSSNAILKRRKAAGMEWVIRNKGVRFVSHPPMGE
jgi:hypothetical protein